MNLDIATHENALMQEFEKQYQKLFSIIYKMTENVHDTEDVLQNVFVKAYRSYDDFRGDASLYTWLYRIAINESYSYMKSWKKLPVIAIAEAGEITEKTFFESLPYTPDTDDHLIIEEMREKCLRGFLRCIPQKMRVCFILKSSLGMKNKEIAEVMDITESNAKVLLYRARARLKEMFEYRCSLIDPDKPCKCFLWIKYMRDRDLPLPDEGINYRDKALEDEYFKNMKLIRKIEYLYHVEHQYTYQQFIEQIKNISEIL